MSEIRLDGDRAKLLHLIRLEIGKNLSGSLHASYIEKQAIRKLSLAIPQTRMLIEELERDGYVKGSRQPGSRALLSIALTDTGIEHEDGGFEREYQKYRGVPGKQLRVERQKAVFALTHYTEDSHEYRQAQVAKERVEDELERLHRRKAVLIPTLVAAVAAIPAVEYIVRNLVAIWRAIFG